MRASQKEYLEYKPAAIDLVKTLIPQSNINDKDAAQKTALLYAAQSYNIYALKELIKAGADVNARDTENNNALNKIATWYLNQKEEFLKTGRIDEFKPLVTDMVTLLIDSGINVNNQDSAGVTPLMYFAAGDASEMVRLLLQRGAFGFLKDNKGETVWEYTRKNSDSFKVLRSYRPVEYEQLILNRLGSAN
jgi:ankyrin repeat protein